MNRRDFAALAATAQPACSYGIDYMNRGAGCDPIFGGASKDMVTGRDYLRMNLNHPGGTSSMGNWLDLAAMWGWGWQPGWDLALEHLAYIDSTGAIGSQWVLHGNRTPGLRLADASQPNTVFVSNGNDLIGGTLDDCKPNGAAGAKSRIRDKHHGAYPVLNVADALRKSVHPVQAAAIPALLAGFAVNKFDARPVA